jgi:hypothetical protein
VLLPAAVHQEDHLAVHPVDDVLESTPQGELAPGRVSILSPAKVHDHHFAAVIGKPPPLPVRVEQIDFRRGIAVHQLKHPVLSLPRSKRWRSAPSHCIRPGTVPRTVRWSPGDEPGERHPPFEQVQTRPVRPGERAQRPVRRVRDLCGGAQGPEHPMRPAAGPRDTLQEVAGG